MSLSRPYPMASRTVTRKYVDGSTREYSRPKQGRKPQAPELKRSQPITFWETPEGEAAINAAAKAAGVSRSAFCAGAVADYLCNYSSRETV